MKIQDIRVGKVSIPLKTPFKTALRRVDTAEDLIVQVRADDGSVGYGNAPATVVITGDSTSPSRRRSCIRSGRSSSAGTSTTGKRYCRLSSRLWSTIRR